MGTKQPWLEGETFGMTNSYWMVIASVATIGAVSQIARGGETLPAFGLPIFGNSNVDAQTYWNGLPAEQRQSLLQAASQATPDF